MSAGFSVFHESQNQNRYIKVEQIRGYVMIGYIVLIIFTGIILLERDKKAEPIPVKNRRNRR